MPEVQFLMKNLVDISIFLILQFAFFSIILISLYQGGSILHPYASEFLFTENYLSDLGRYSYYNGDINPFSIFFTLSLTLAGVGIGTFFYVFSRFCQKKIFLPLIFGIISAIGMIGISIFWSDITHKHHFFFGRLAYLGFFGASISLNYQVNKKKFPSIYKALLFLNISLTIFLIILILIDYKILFNRYTSKIHFTAMMQKLVTALQIFTVTYILLVLNKINKKINIL